MDEVNINKYFSQFNPILIVPVLSAVIGAILVFVFGFKRPNEPRFQTSSSTDSLKKSKRKTNTSKNSDINTQSSKQVSASTKVGPSRKPTDAAVTVTSKKGSAVEKSSNNNNNLSSNNNNINKKKNDEKKSENGSPLKKITNKKAGKETSASKKGKSNKNTSADHDDKPTDFDDDGWFTVQSKSTKQKNKIDDSAVNQTENASPKVQEKKNIKTTKVPKVEVKQSINQVIPSESINESEKLVDEQQHDRKNAIENGISIEDEQPAVVTTEVERVFDEVEEENYIAPIPVKFVDLQTVENVIVFDELGEWTDAKPDRKRGNKKKSRKD